MLWALQSGASRVVSCIEANEMGFDFVNTCSRCDYYMQNHALNAKALKLPSLVLSSMWQCTGNHILGDLYHHQIPTGLLKSWGIMHTWLLNHLSGQATIIVAVESGWDWHLTIIHLNWRSKMHHCPHHPYLSCCLWKHLAYLYVLHHCLCHPYLSWHPWKQRYLNATTVNKKEMRPGQNY